MVEVLAAVEPWVAAFGLKPAAAPPLSTWLISHVVDHCIYYDVHIEVLAGLYQGSKLLCCTRSAGEVV